MSVPKLKDLVREAGVILPDWESPSNPKYCYEWAFSDGQNAVLTQWYRDIQQEGSRIYCEIIPDDVLQEFSDWSGRQRNRFLRVVQIFEQFADTDDSLRVVVVSGIHRFLSEGKPDKVKRRQLDPVTWKVHRMQDREGFVLERSSLNPPLLNPGLEEAKNTPQLITRIAYNSEDWHHPTGEAANEEGKSSYVVKMRFGHEEWLFRNEWLLDGWRYSFLQGVHKGGKRYENQVVDIDLCTIMPAPGRERRLVARIADVEVLSEPQAKEVYQRFEENGWLDQMEAEVRGEDGNSQPLRSPTTFREMFNIRFKADKVSFYPKGTPLTEGISASQVNRYQIFNITEISPEPTAGSRTRGRIGQGHVEPAGPRTRRPTSATTYTPEHQNIQRKLVEKLKSEYGPDSVLAEQDFVDVRVETEQELIYYEIKTELDPRLVIRQALGQLLEYAFYQGRRETRTPTGLVIVGRCPLDQDSDAYLREIDRFLPMPLTYMEISL